MTTRRGRPRKQGVPRDDKGRIAYGHRTITENPDAMTATVEEARIRHILGVDVFITARRNERALAEARKKVSNPLLGYSLGRFLFAEEIDRKQHDAGLYFVWLWKANARLRGWPSPNVRSIGADMTGAGLYSAAELDPDLATDPEEKKRIEDRISDVKRKWEDCHRAIWDANADHGRSTAPIMEILKRTLVEDIGPRNKIELGNLRIGLNAINQAKGG